MWRKKIIVPPYVTKVWSEVMLVLPNVTIELPNVRKKNKVPPNATKVRSEVMLVLSNVTIELSNARKVLYI